MGRTRGHLVVMATAGRRRVPSPSMTAAARLGFFGLALAAALGTTACKGAAEKDYETCVQYEAADSCRAAVTADPSGATGKAAAAWLAAHAAPSASPVVAPPASAPAAPSSVTVSLATFTPKDTLLDECIDLTMPVPPGVDAGRVGDGLGQLATQGKTATMSRIYKLCSEQFKDMPILATCVSHLSLQRDGGSRTVEIESVERYYNIDTLTSSNGYMKNCLDMRGDWSAADRDSPEYRAAVRARARRDIEKAQKLLGQ
jgi:hypothetical protein